MRQIEEKFCTSDARVGYSRIVYTTWSPRSRAERLIALGRLILALVSLAAIYLDPTEPAKFAAQTYFLLAAYSVFAIVAIIITWSSPAAVVRFGVVIHAADLTVYSVLVYLTEGPTSPFFAWFVFALFSAALRFGRRGTIWTAVIAILIFMVMGAASLGLDDETFELNRFLIRGVYLGIVAALLVYLAHYQSALQADLLSLSIWPRTRSLEFRAVATDVLERASEMLLVPRVVLLMREWGGGSWQETVWNRGTLDERVPLPIEPLRTDVHGGFLIRDITASSHEAISSLRGRVSEIDRAPLSVEMIARHQVRSILGIELDGSTFDGWLLFLDRDDFTIDDLTLGEALRHPVVAQLDAHLMAQQAERAAVATERFRLAQQIHDGLLQSMAGVVHYLEAVHKMLESDPQAARQKVTEVQALLMEDQRNLRMFLQQLTPTEFRAERDLTNQLHELAERLRLQWGLRIELRLQSLDEVTPELRGEIYNLSSEALFNIVKHAEAETARLRVEAQGAIIELTVEDDGHGFPFEGCHTLSELEDARRGPLSLKRRVASLGGDMTLESGPSGARLEIRIPIAGASNE